MLVTIISLNFTDTEKEIMINICCSELNTKYGAEVRCSGCGVRTSMNATVINNSLAWYSKDEWFVHKDYPYCSKKCLTRLLKIRHSDAVTAWQLSGCIGTASIIEK